MDGVDQQLALPTIDPRTPEAPAQLAAACADVGFFRIPADLFADGVIESALTTAARFFELPTGVKKRVGFPEPGYPYGYAPFQSERLAASLGDQKSLPDLKESFSVGPDCLGPDHPGGAGEPGSGEAWVRSPSLWPDEPQPLRAAWETCFQAMSGVAGELLSAMALALDLPGDYFKPMIDRHSSAMRALHYPPLNEPVADLALRAGAHTDYGTLTILATDDVPGLEILDRRYRWRPVAHVPGTHVVNLGDSIAQWTNDRWRSTMHRVTTVSGEPRHSLAFFHTANWDATIACLPTCHGPDNPPLYPPVKAGPWLMEKFTRTLE